MVKNIIKEWVDNSSNNKKNNQYIAPEQAIDLTISGLKPSTKHSFYFDGEDKTAKCKPSGGQIGDDLVSNSSGILSIKFYFDFGFSSNMQFSSMSELNSYLAGISTKKKMEVRNSDGTSKATDAIKLSVNDKFLTKTNKGVFGPIVLEYDGVELR